MKNSLKFTVLLFIIATYSTTIYSQSKSKKNSLSGYVKDINGNIIKDVVFFVDEVKTKTKVNSFGAYKLKINAETQKIKAFSYSRGVIEIDYEGQKNIDFIYNNYNCISSKISTYSK